MKGGFESLSRKHSRRDPNATWCQKQAPYDFIKYWTKLREANSAFLRLQKYEPESERPGRTSGCHRSGQHVNAASWIFHTQLDAWATQQWGNVQKYHLAINTVGGCELVMSLTSSMHVLLFLPHFLSRQILKWLLSPLLTVTVYSLHTHKIRSVKSILCFENMSFSWGQNEECPRLTFQTTVGIQKGRQERNKSLSELLVFQAENSRCIVKI